MAPVDLKPVLRLLVAEDDAMNRDVMEQVLRRMGHDVVMAGDGAEAVAYLQRGPGFDAVLLDLQMPVMDGLTAARTIRALPGPAGRTSLLAVTGDAIPEDREACLAAGMNGFLAKPWTIARLTAALDELTKDRPVAIGPPSGPPPGVSIDAQHRQSLLDALRPGSLERLLAVFWEEIAEDVPALVAADADAKQRNERLHRLGGTAATLGYAEIAAIASDLRHDPEADLARLMDAMRKALAADAALLPGAVVDTVRAALL